MAALLRQMHASQYAPSEQLEFAQRRALAGLLDHAISSSPYYRDVLGVVGQVSPASALERLAEMPFLTKSVLQESADHLRCSAYSGRVSRKITGGSTGQAVTVYKNSSAIAAEMAATWRGYGWFGLRVGDRAARFWGSPHSLKRRPRFAAADFAMHRIRFSAFAFDDGDLERYWQRCLRFRPRYFYGYVSMLEAFADFVQRRGYDGRSLGLTAIVTTSEVLSPPQRELLRRVFGAPVQNEYGCGEVGPIAYECEKGSLHIMAENLLVEIVTKEGHAAQRGETGEIVVTDLNNRAMPLIRYRLADFGIPGGPCSCGRTLPVLERIWGREYDFVESPTGRRFHGEFFMYCFEDLRAQGLPVRQFQVTQRAADRLQVRVVLAETVTGDALQPIERGVAESLPDFRVEVTQAESIERAPSGKMRIITNPWMDSLRGQSLSETRTA